MRLTTALPEWAFRVVGRRAAAYFRQSASIQTAFPENPASTRGRAAELVNRLRHRPLDGVLAGDVRSGLVPD